MISAKRACLVWLCLLALVLPGRSADWQWSLAVSNSLENPGVARAWLWIPSDCQRVRGVVVAQHNMEEISILENPFFRGRLAEMGFAEIWVAPFFDHLFRFNEGAGETFDAIINGLAAESGYAELKHAPVVPLGHSAAASWPYYFAAWNPSRTLAALSISGQWPYVRSREFAPDIWGDRTIDFIPCLESMGEYEAANDWSREGLRERQDHPRLPLSMLANPGQGHFANTDAKAAYLSLYINKAVQYRVPQDWDGAAAPRLIPIDPTRTGWLADKWRLDQPPAAPAAPVGQYRGDSNQALWFFDEELAKATEQYQSVGRGLKPQLVGFVQNGILVPQRNSHLQVDLKFAPAPDGVTFKLQGAFYDAVPAGSPRLPQWTGLPIGSPLGHATSGDIQIDRICGPFRKLGPDTFAVDFQRETLFGQNVRSYELVLAASHPGNAHFKPAVQQAHLIIPARNLEGGDQQLTFPRLANQHVGTKSVTLAATSNSGRKVMYYVREGPAEIENDVLRFTAIPSRAKFPVKVTVVAWQYGSAVEPKMKSAESITQTLLITR